MARQQLRLEDMNRLALACVTVVAVRLVGVLGVVGIYLDGAELNVAVAAVVDDDENDVARVVESDKLFSTTANIFELYDHQLQK